jgi:adenylate cyclase
MAERIRITAQLIDAETGNHVWAERFDRPLTDLFAVQDEVVRTIVGTLVGRVYTNEAERLRRKPPSSLTAYDLTLRGNWLPWDDPILGREAKHAFERAIEVDPGYGLPHSFLAVVLLFDWLNDPFESDHILDRALALAQRGVDPATRSWERSIFVAVRSIWRCATWNAASRSTSLILGGRPIWAAF